MKKCASCTKDLPDAALHCVFCGAKQAASPAVQPTNAKTVMGYGGQELDALRAQAAARNAAASSPPPMAPAPVAPAPAPYTPPAAAPYTPPAPAPYAPPAAAPYTPPAAAQPAPYAPPAAAQPAPYVPPRAHTPSQQPLAPASSANAKTMFVENGPPAAAPANVGIGQDRTMMAPPAQQAGAFNVPPPSAATLAQAKANQLPLPSAQPLQPVQPVQPVAQASPPYLASQTAARAGRPIEPWKDALPMMMFIWGGLLIAAFVTPISTDPMAFNWDAIIHGEGAQKLGPLILAATGLLTVAMAAIPLATGVRGTMALLLGLTGVFVPMFIGGAVPPWQAIVSTLGMVMLPMSLLARHEYRDASLPRILVTIGALCALVPYVVPVNGTVVLVELFKGVIDAPGALKILLILVLGQVMLVVLSLLAWLPSPASGGAKPIAWLLILYPLFMHAALLFLVGDPANITNTPYAGAMSWLVGGAGGGGGEMAGLFGGGAGIGVAYLAITGYGGATVLGKQLE